MPSEKPNPKKTAKKVGRPSTGKTREVIKATVDSKIVAEAKKLAMKNGESFAAFVARAIHSQLVRSL